MTEILNFTKGINWRLPAWLLPEGQCIYLQNLTAKDGYVENIAGTKKYCGTSLGSDPVTAIIPHYDDDGVNSAVLVASGAGIYKRDDGANEFTSIKGGLAPNRIISACSRHGVTYIASDEDRLMKFEHASSQMIYQVGGGSTRPGNYQIIVYMKEIDRMFGLRHNTIHGQIGWSGISTPEQWDAANVDRIKLQDGERTETGDVLYGKLIIFNTYSIWIYYVSGNPENWKLEQAPTTVGIRAVKTLKRVGNEFWFLGDSPRTGKGIYAFNGSVCRLLTDDVQPLMDRINSHTIDEACAEYHDGIYRLSFPLDFRSSNSHSIDLDNENLKEDGTPAIYGPHTSFFHSSAVLNTRQRGGEFLMGDYSDGFVYKLGGISFKAGDSGTDGALMQHRFLSPIYNDGKWNVMKFYPSFGVHFLPRGYLEAKLKAYFSYGTYDRNFDFYPDAAVHSIMGNFNVFTDRVLGGPALAQHIQHLGLDARGVSIQIEILNDTISQLAFQGITYETEELYETKKAQIYAS